MGLKMKNVNTMVTHQYSGEVGHQKQLYIRNYLKRGLGQFAGGLAKNRESGVFFWGGGGGG